MDSIFVCGRRERNNPCVGKEVKGRSTLNWIYGSPFLSWFYYTSSNKREGSDNPLWKTTAACSSL